CINWYPHRSTRSVSQSPRHARQKSHVSFPLPKRPPTDICFCQMYKLRADIPSGSFSTTRLSDWLSKCEAALPGCRFFQSGPLANGLLLGCSVAGCLRCTYLKSPLEIVVQ